MGFGNEVRTILLVDDDEVLLRSLARGLRDWPGEVLTATTLQSAIEIIHAGVDVVVTDVVLDEDSGVEVALAAAKQVPKPVVLAMSALAEPRVAFELGQAGVRAYLPKPFAAAELQDAIVTALEGPPAGHVPDLRELVGRSRLLDVGRAIRQDMIEEALAKVDGNKAKAAQLLGITRQHLQNILRRQPIARRRSRP